MLHHLLHTCNLILIHVCFLHCRLAIQILNETNKIGAPGSSTAAPNLAASAALAAGDSQTAGRISLGVLLFFSAVIGIFLCWAVVSAIRDCVHHDEDGDALSPAKYEKQKRDPNARSRPTMGARAFVNNEGLLDRSMRRSKEEAAAASSADQCSPCDDTEEQAQPGTPTQKRAKSMLEQWAYGDDEEQAKIAGTATPRKEGRRVSLSPPPEQQAPRPPPEREKTVIL